MNPKIKNLIAIIMFGFAFGMVEAAVVIYLRDLINFKDTYTIGTYTTILNLGFIAVITTPAQIFPSFQTTEMIREVATILMLATFAYIAGNNFRSRFAAFVVAFSFWDIFYYIFLKLFVGWPKTFFDLDIFFLIPTMWIGPVITPLVIFTIAGILGIRYYLEESKHSSNSK